MKAFLYIHHSFIFENRSCNTFISINWLSEITIDLLRNFFIYNRILFGRTDIVYLVVFSPLLLTKDNPSSFRAIPLDYKTNVCGSDATSTGTPLIRELFLVTGSVCAAEGSDRLMCWKIRFFCFYFCLCQIIPLLNFLSFRTMAFLLFLFPRP